MVIYTPALPQKRCYRLRLNSSYKPHDRFLGSSAQIVTFYSIFVPCDVACVLPQGCDRLEGLSTRIKILAYNKLDAATVPDELRSL